MAINTKAHARQPEIWELRQMAQSQNGVIHIYIYAHPPPMIHPNDGPSLLQSVWAQVQTIFYVKQTELVQKNK